MSYDLFHNRFGRMVVLVAMVGGLKALAEQPVLVALAALVIVAGLFVPSDSLLGTWLDE